MLFEMKQVVHYVWSKVNLEWACLYLQVYCFKYVLLNRLVKEIVGVQLVLRLCLKMEDLHFNVTFFKDNLEQVPLLLVSEYLLHKISEMLSIQSLKNLVLQISCLLPETSGYKHLANAIPVHTQTLHREVLQN